jgi:oligopeptide/dipeptide ABC transporter ATP-binding protein
MLDVNDLVVEFDTYDGRVRVLQQLSFSLEPNETLCIVGESGSGKSVSALAILGLVPKPNGHVTGGAITLEGEDLLKASSKRMRQIRGNEISMIFQEPMTSLNPVYSVGEQIAEALRDHKGMGRTEAWQAAIRMLERVHIPEARLRAKEFPHQFSGGMRQRVMIAIALACAPKVLIADEPTTALDVTVQAQVFALLRELQRQQGTAIILITHDMGAVSEMADRVVVMYAGRKVEEGPVDEVLDRPAHPYTKGLLACRPRLTVGAPSVRSRLAEIPGTVPPLHLLKQGCAFAPRCSARIDRCDTETPPEVRISPRHSASCWVAASQA